MWLTELRRNLPPDIVLHVVGTKADIVARDPTRREVAFERCIAYVAENLAPGLGSTPPPTAISSSLALIRKHRSFRKSRLPPKIEVTSCPAPPSTCQAQNSSKLNNNSTKAPSPELPSREDDIEQWAKDNLNSQIGERP